MKKIKIHPGWIPVYVIALLLGILSLNTMAGAFVAPVVACAVLSILLSSIPRFRHLRFVGHLAATAVVGFFMFMLFIDPIIAPYRAKYESRRILTAASNAEELREAVGSLGIFLPYANGEWIAIRYRDSHAWPGWSSAIALDSDKQFYESRHHFCGKLRAYHTIAQKQADISKELESLGETNTVSYLSGFEEIHALATADGLQNATPQLLKMGFKRLDK